MEKVLREFGFDKNQTQNYECPPSAPLQECPLGWFRIIDSCIWVSPPDMTLDAENATLYCKTKLPTARLFEPRTQILNTLVPELVTFLDGSHLNENFWLGMNDKVNERQFVYTSSGEPVGFTNWLDGQPDGRTSQNCVVFAQREESKKKWRDDGCHHARRFICEKFLK